VASSTVLPVPKIGGKMGPSTMTPWQSCGHIPGPALRGVVAPLLLLALALPTCSRRESGAPPELEEVAAISAAPEATQGDLSLSVDAKPETFELLREDLETVRSPADGGGRAWLESSAGSDAGGRRQIPAGSRQRFSIVYQAGPLGIAPGGAVFLQVSPFWEWDWPQTRFPEGPGYTEVTTRAEGIELQPKNWGQELLAVQIAGRTLEAGEEVRIEYGAGAAGAQVDRYAERNTHIWIAVDGDGDGVRSLIQDSPRLDIVAAEATQLRLTLPTTAHTGDSVRLVVAVLDGWGNAGAPFEGEIELLELPPGLELPERIALGAEEEGRRTLQGKVLEPGLYRLRARVSSAPEDAVFESNPLLVRDDLPQVLWGDLHGHSNYSDGTGTPADYYRYARDVAGLDVAALTDHDHWGMRFLDTTPELWEDIRETTKRFHEPGRFVTLLGYEWTSWLHGHRHVLYFSDEGQVLSSIDPDTQTPSQLWRALDGQSALTFAHHSAGGPISVNWRYRPDPEIEPITEIVSVHGSSEALDSPGTIYNPLPGNFVRDALDHGYRFGFIGSGDSHDGHPGLTQLAAGAGQGGLAAIMAHDRTRQDVLQALRARRTYATNGPRIFLHVQIDGHLMGSQLPRPLAEAEDEPAPQEQGAVDTQRLEYEAVGTGPIERIDFVRSGHIAAVPGEGRSQLSGVRVIPRLRSGEYVYLRVVQRDGGTAWSSPIYGD
jgi:hypothetical protein